MSKRFSLLVLLCALSLACVTAAQDRPALDFDPGHQRAVTLVTPDLSAEVVAQAPDASTGQSRSILLNTRAGKAVVSLPFEFAQVNAIFLGPPQRLVIEGMSAGSVYVVGIVDTVADKLVDTFTCYQPAISPDGYYIAFTKLFGPHSSPSPEDHSMIYSVARSASENRPRGIRRDDEVDVGFAAYPWGIANSMADNLDVPRKSAHTVGGGYRWRDSQYFFADRVAGKVQIVWVAIANEIATVRSLAMSASQLGPARNDFPPTLVDAELEGDKLKLTVSTNQARTIVASTAEFVRLGSISLSGQPAGAAAVPKE
jgi:hypothetical protein